MAFPIPSDHLVTKQSIFAVRFAGKFKLWDVRRCSDNEYTMAVLRNPVVGRIHRFPSNDVFRLCLVRFFVALQPPIMVLPQLVVRWSYRRESKLSQNVLEVWDKGGPYQSPNILEKNGLRTKSPDRPKDLRKEISAVLFGEMPTAETERLARRSGGQKAYWTRYALPIDFAHVTFFDLRRQGRLC